MPSIEPFVRWAGGKSWLVPYIKNLIGTTTIEHYHEPFVGGGAVFFALTHNKKSYISDSNVGLINLYKQTRDNPQAIITALQHFSNDKDNYYQIRDHFHSDDLALQAARFLFLNQTSFNGLFRVNRNGDYNVPYGYRTNWTYNENRIFDASEKLKNTNISFGDFTINKYKIKRHDLVFLDPPYTVSPNNNCFIEYNQKLFSLDDQRRLSSFIDYIKRKDAYYILTNAAHPTIQQIFTKDGDFCHTVNRLSLIGGKNAKRASVTEYVFTNLPRGGDPNV